jgi:hypothetical protein
MFLEGIFRNLFARPDPGQALCVARLAQASRGTARLFLLRMGLSVATKAQFERKRDENS